MSFVTRGRCCRAIAASPGAVTSVFSLRERVGEGLCVRFVGALPTCAFDSFGWTALLTPQFRVAALVSSARLRALIGARQAF